MTRRAIKPGLRVTTGLRAALYLRQSLDLAGDEMAVTRQEQANRAYCKAKGWTVVVVYRENDTSAAGRRPRPKFDQMLADAKAGKFDVIVATFLDRLTRSVRDLLPLIDLYRAHGVATATVRDSIDLTTDVGELVATILAAVANLEIKRKGERQTLANQQRADVGDPHIGGPAPLGYERVERGPKEQHLPKLVVNPTEAKVIREGYQMVLAGVSCSAIARYFNEAGLRTRNLKTKRQGAFGHHAVADVLTNPRNAGLRQHLGEIVGQANWEPIVDRDVWEAACRKLTDPSRRSNPHPGGMRRWLGTGVYRCGVCDANGVEETLVSSYRDDGTRIYKCRTAKHLARGPGDTIDAFVVDELCAELARPDAADLLLDTDSPDLPALQKRESELLTRLEETAADRANGAISRSQLLIITRKVNAALEVVQSAMVRSDRADLLADFIAADDPRAVWDAAGLDRQRAVLACLFDVVLLKGRPGGNSRSGPRPLDVSTIEIRPVHADRGNTRRRSGSKRLAAAQAPPEPARRVRAVAPSARRVRAG
jgi:site-specific DNA recombinase